MQRSLGRCLVSAGSLLLLLALAAGCGGSSGGSGGSGADTTGDTPGLPDVQLPPPGEAQIDTAVSPERVVIGQPVTVTCTVTPDKWADAPTEVRAVGGEVGAVRIAGHTVTFSALGGFALSCAIPGTDVLDASPALVTVVTAGATTVDTAVAPNPVTAGQPATVTCSARDVQGQPVEGVSFDVTVNPREGVTLTGTTLSATLAGQLSVSCAARGGAADATPARLDVVAGPLAKVTAQLARSEIPAGEATTVTCRATDGFGNGVVGSAFGVAADQPVTVQGAEVSGTTAGRYTVRCVWADGDDASIDHVNAQLTVTAGPAAELVLRAVPERAVYRVGNQVTIERAVVDAWGNPVPDPDVTEVAVTPEQGMVRLSDEAFRFAAEGSYTFMAQLHSAPAIEDRLTLFCDGQGPSVAIDYPLRGETLDGPTAVTVTGAVTDQVSGVASLLINGETVTVGADGSFSHPLRAVHGMNVIAVEATDNAGQVEQSWRSFYYSDHWYPMSRARPQDAMVGRAVLAYLAEESLDSDDPDVFDAAALFTLILADLDLASMIPRPATTQSVGWCTYRVYIDSLSYGDPIISLDTFGRAGGRPGGIHLRAVLPNLYAFVDAPAPEFACPDVTAIVTADSVVLEADLYLEVAPGGAVQTSVVVNSIVINRLNVNVQGVLGFLSNWLINFFEDDIAGIIQDQFAATIEEQVGELVAGLMDFLNLEQQFELGPLVGEGPPTVLDLSARVASIEFTDAGGFVVLDGALLSDRLIDRDPLGSIGRGGCAGGAVGQYSLPGAAPIELAVYDDLLNQALFSFWYGGGLEFHLTPTDFAALGADLSQFGLGDEMTVDVHLLLPPIVEGCANDGKVLVQLGDAYVEASFAFLGTPTELKMYLQLAIDATIVLQPGETGGVEVGVRLGELRRFEVEVVEINEQQADKQKTFEDLIKTLVPTLLRDLAADPITFALPSIDLGELSDSLPEGLWLSVEPEQVSRTLGYTMAAGRLVEGTPPQE
jgi:hypothetical protein